MKNLKTLLIVTASACALASSAYAIKIDTSYVGDMGNSADTLNYGAVYYGYHVGTYEVTNSQYVSFLNAMASKDTHGLYNTNMTTGTYNSVRIGGINRSGTSGSYTYTAETGFEEKAVNYVSFWDAARFTNYLTTGSTETGVYTLNNVTNPANGDITRNKVAWGNGGVAVASEDEWYKAAYYKGGSTTAGYWDYAHQSDLITTADANYATTTVTDVGTYSDYASYYGTFDQGGNVWEWNEATVASSYRGLRGGAFSDANNIGLQSSNRSDFGPSSEAGGIGFRVSSLAPIPESSTYAAILGCLTLAIASTRRKGRRTL